MFCSFAFSIPKSDEHIGIIGHFSIAFESGTFTVPVPISRELFYGVSWLSSFLKKYNPDEKYFRKGIKIGWRFF
jgi:hypothetical protein